MATLREHPSFNSPVSPQREGDPSLLTSLTSSIELVTPSPDLKCPICLQLLREPYITNCCGHHYCQRCIERVQNSFQPCPMCRREEFNIFPNLDKKREILAREVYCVNKVSGCPWKGPLSSLYEQHINKGQCTFAKRPCRYNCGQSFRTQDLPIHEAQCSHMPIERSVRIMRDEQSRMMGEINSLKKENKSLKEENKVLKKDIETIREQHYSDISRVLETQREMELQIIQGRRGIDNLTREFDRFKTQYEDVPSCLSIVQENRSDIIQINSLVDKTIKLHTLVDELQLMCISTPPIILTLKGFENYKGKGSWWQSDPFYSHPGGYKFRLEVKPAGTGNGAGSHVSVYVHVMRGKYDEKLKWPLCAYVHFRLLDVLQGQNHFENKVFFARENEASVRVLDKETGTGRGYAQFIPNTQLARRDVKYLHDDSLMIEILRVEFVNK